MRVYRGQTKDYPAIKPSGLRRPIRKSAIWTVYSTHLYLELIGNFSGEFTEEWGQASVVWFNAVSQHYGPGSDFLDVTHSVSAALWFALNADEPFEERAVIGPEESTDASLNYVVTTESLRFRPVEAGFLYAFDVPKWDPKNTLAEAGLLVDLADAPEIFSSSPRMRAQAGCLIYCRNRDGSQLDMRTHLVPGTPLPVSRPMNDAPDFNRRTSDIFPSPAVDKWYAKFLSVPLTFAAEPSPPTLRRSIPVTVYSDPPNEQYRQETSYRDVVVPSPLIHRLLAKEEGADGLIPILLEAPLMFPYAAGDSDLWHHALLWHDLPDKCECYELGGEEARGEISLRNILFEFSPLEDIGWERLIDERKPIELLRALWVQRNGAQISAAFVSQNIPQRSAGLSSFMPVSYDEISQQLVFPPAADDHAGAPVPIISQPLWAKPILIALMLLRYLSRNLKAEPTPRLRAGNTILLGCARDAARLFRVANDRQDWYVLRDRHHPEEPFTRPTGDDGYLKLEWDKSFRELPLEMIRNALPRA